MTTLAETSCTEFSPPIGVLPEAPTAAPKAAPPPLPAGIERRVATRVELCIGVGFLSDTNFYTGFTSDLSEGGLFVATHMLQPIGSRITLTFALPTGAEITVRGIIRWRRDPSTFDAAAPPGMGVQFLGLRPADHAAIRKLIALREPTFYQA